MSIVLANLGASANPDINNSANQTSYANLSWTPPVSGLIILFVLATRATGPDTPTVSGNSLTWTQIGTTLDCGAGGTGLSLFAADASGSAAGVTTIDFGANTQASCNASFFEATGVDLTGGVAAAFVQNPRNTAASGTTGTVTLSAAAHADNRPIVGFFHQANEAATERANWTEADDLAGSAGIRDLETQWRADAFETTATATWASSSAWGGIAAELKAEVGSSPYSDMVKATFGASLLAYWPLWEPSGTIATDISGNGRDGVHTGVTLGQPGIGDGRTSALYGGDGDRTNVYSTSLRDAFNGAEGTVMVWAKVSEVGVWTDATQRRLFYLAADSSNRVYMSREATNNILGVYYAAGGTLKSVALSLSSIAWLRLIITWNKSIDQMKAHLDGIQQGATQTGLGTWAGQLASSTTLLASGSTGGASPWFGYLAHVALGNRALTAAEVAALSGGWGQLLASQRNRMVR